uniref:Homing endonuclease LAGLIDADG domain-containing protein n=1 Tax=Malassezia obtusa TaxID=76774 RepID=A0A2I6QCM3_9BASI|nr:hypothetical protein [Malassezia obtusa]
MGDGTFYFTKTKKGNWNFYFKVVQNKSNLRMLYYIKSIIKVGSIQTTSNINTSNSIIAHYLIQDKKAIIQYLLPIFDKYSLLTSKEFHYNQFRKAILISENSNLAKKDKDNIILCIKNDIMPNNYTSSAWKSYNIDNLTTPVVNTIMSKEWLVGFAEVKGNFYLTYSKYKYISHFFAITQKQDKIVINAIAVKLNLGFYEKEGNNFYCKTTNKESIQYIIEYFHNTIKGIKSLEYRIWARSFNKKFPYQELVKVRNKMKKLFN